MNRLLMWQNTKRGPVFCSSVIFRELDNGIIELEAYSERLLNYLVKSDPFTDFELAEPYGFPIFGFRRLLIDAPQHPTREDEPFIFNMYPRL